jgi:hypothetical protein
MAALQPGDCVVYHKPKTSACPGPHARDVRPAPLGDSYSYSVPKFYRVVEVRPGPAVVVRTRRGRLRTLAAGDPALHRAAWWERLLFGPRFPPPEG